MDITIDNITELKHKVEHPVLKAWSLKHGIIDCVMTVRACLKAGFGYMGTQRIDNKFIKSLSNNDRCLYNGVLAWIDLMKTK